MSCIEGLLRATSAELETRLAEQLHGFFGGVVRSYLPQAWVFRTESETVALLVDPQGRITVAPGTSDHPDVTVEIPHARLEAALRTRRREKVPPGPISVTAHTAKGRTAFDFLRSRIGL